MTPLVYSTEIARSVRIGNPTKLEVPGVGQPVQDQRLDDTKVSYSVSKSGDRRPSKKVSTFDKTKVVGGLVYGLVNVRTDGDKILFATLSEKDTSWEIKTIRSRFKSGSHQLR